VTEMSAEQLHKLAECHLRDFVRTIHNLVVIDGVKFDLIIGPGNSGLVMLKITELIFDHCKWKFPPQLKLPIQRYMKGTDGELHNNISLMPCAKEQMHGISSLTNVLFVDDEMGKGTTVKASLALMRAAANSKLLKLSYEQNHCHIVVELRDWPLSFGIPVVRPFIHHFATMSNLHRNKVIVNYLRPPAILDDIEKFLKSLDTDNEKFGDKCLNIALGTQSKVYDHNLDVPPVFTEQLNEKAKAKLPGLDDIRANFRDYLSELIKEALDTASKSKDNKY